MKILEGDTPILRQKATAVKDFDQDLWDTCEEMLALMKKEDGVGLAASQVGIPKRFFVADIGIIDNAFINPRIVGAEGVLRVSEGCLSFPGVFLEVMRAKTVELEFQDREGNNRFVKATGIPAVIIQHEMDHLDGILFTDHFAKNKIVVK